MQPRRLQYQKRIKLISGGYIKPECFPGGEITVFPWDTNIDDWLNEHVRKGGRQTAMFDLCAKLCDLNGCPLDSFVMGDVTTVLLVSRALRHGGTVAYNWDCPVCAASGREEIRLPDDLGKLGEKAPNYPGYDLIRLPECQDEVAIRPLLVGDEKRILEREPISKRLMSDTIMHILTPVQAINGGNPEVWEDLVRWYQALPPQDAQFLEDQENLLYPHLDTNIPHTCDSCRAKFKQALSINTEFFRASLKADERSRVAPALRSGLDREGAGNQPQGSAGPHPGPHDRVGQ
jgi:hypothetical protein